MNIKYFVVEIDRIIQSFFFKARPLQRDAYFFGYSLCSNNNKKDKRRTNLRIKLIDQESVYTELKIIKKNKIINYPAGQACQLHF